jgi:uncharacterized protein YprB with RNaseH-like and TPR domain
VTLDPARAATVAALREKLARLGGVPGMGRGSAAIAVRDAAAGSETAARVGGQADAEELPAGELPPGRIILGAPGHLGASLEGLGFVPEVTPSGLAWVRRVSVELQPFLEQAGAAAPVTAGQLVRLAYAMPEPHPEPAWGDDSVAVLDIETLGLRGSGVVAFLVGIGVPRGSRLDIDQLLLPGLDEEPALLLAMLARLERVRMLVTYNGRTFDLPLLRGRCIVNRVSGGALDPPLHCDLLGPVRRLFRDRLGACTLRQAEESLLRLYRENDISGSEAPSRYWIWLRGGDAAVVEGVVRHNQLDLSATMVLAARLAAHVDGSLVQPAHPADRYRLGVHLERGGGVADGVEEHYRATLRRAVAPWDRHAAVRLARRLRREGGEAGREEAAEVLEAMWRRDPTDLRVGMLLALTLERRRHFDAALRVCDEALAACSQLGAWRLERMRGAPHGGWADSWERRRRRLSRRREIAMRPKRLRSGAQRPPVLAGACGVVAGTCPPLFANWSQGTCQSASPSEESATRLVFLTTTTSPC